MTDRPEISIVGPGKVGTALGVLAWRAGWPVAAVGGRRLARAQAAARMISPDVQAASPAEAAAAGRLVLLTVSDEAIGPLCGRLVEAGAFRPGAVVAHCSGALGSEILSAARDQCRCAVASCHPLQTFPTAKAAVERLSGAYFFYEGDEAATAVLEVLIGAIGGKGVPIPAGGDGKALYHAGAVMACNHLTALMDAAVSLMEQAGVDRRAALAALVPMVRATVENIAEMGPQDALTGPIARGDADTVRRHLSAIAGQAELAAFYRAAARWTAGLARRKGTLGGSAAQAMDELLAGDGAEQP